MNNSNPESRARLIQLAILIAGIIIGLLIGLVLFKNKDKVESLIEGAEREAGSIPIGIDRNTAMNQNLPEISVTDQYPGEYVIVEKAVLAEPGWIVIYTDLEGNPASILGAQYFNAGEYENITVRVQAPTIMASTYHALIHSDDGKIVESEYGRHQFDQTLDLPALDSEGNSIKDTFKTLSIGSRGL